MELVPSELLSFRKFCTTSKFPLFALVSAAGSGFSLSTGRPLIFMELLAPIWTQLPAENMISASAPAPVFTSSPSLSGSPNEAGDDVPAWITVTGPLHDVRTAAGADVSERATPAKTARTAARKTVRRSRECMATSSLIC
jgi:hypothetical protein